MFSTRALARPVAVAGPVTAVLIAALAGGLVLAGRDDPQPAVAPLSSALPPEASYDDTEDLDKDLAHFAHVAWQQFAALNWPARADTRGKPDPGKKFGDRADNVVWGSWKSLDETFPQDEPQTNRPTAWDSFDAVISARRLDKDGKAALHRFDGLPDKDAGRRKILSQVNRLGTINQPGTTPVPFAPLIAQNGTYVRYEVRMDRTAYEFITEKAYYLRKNLPSQTGRQPVAFPDGSIVVKAAWMEIMPGDAGDRFYHIPAEVVEWTEDGRETLRPTTVGLVGLHIMRKEKERPSWTWSTFEHVDNTEPGPGATRASFSRNDPTVVHCAQGGGVDYKPQVPPANKPLPLQNPVDVKRVNDIPEAIRRVNADYHKRAEVQGTPWQNYQLVGVQWVRKPDPGGDPDITPTLRPKERVTNTTLETYIQKSSCVACHAGAGMDLKFVFFPTVRAHPPATGP